MTITSSGIQIAYNNWNIIVQNYTTMITPYTSLTVAYERNCPLEWFHIYQIDFDRLHKLLPKTKKRRRTKRMMMYVLCFFSCLSYVSFLSFLFYPSCAFYLSFLLFSFVSLTCIFLYSLCYFHHYSHCYYYHLRYRCVFLVDHDLLIRILNHQTLPFPIIEIQILEDDDKKRTVDNRTNTHWLQSIIMIRKKFINHNTFVSVIWQCWHTHCFGRSETAFRFLSLASSSLSRFWLDELIV